MQIQYSVQNQQSRYKFDLVINGETHAVQGYGDSGASGHGSASLNSNGYFAAGSIDNFGLELLVTRIAHKSNLAGYREQKIDNIERI